MGKWTEKQLKSCFFTGHRVIAKSDIPLIEKALATAIDEKISAGIKNFACGGALGFDTMAALAVLKRKNAYTDIRLTLFLPCPSQHERWSAADRARYEDIKNRADEVVYTSEFYFPGCMQLRDRRMAESAAYCICWCKHLRGGTAYTLSYAREIGVEVERLCT